MDSLVSTSGHLQVPMMKQELAISVALAPRLARPSEVPSHHTLAMTTSVTVDLAGHLKTATTRTTHCGTGRGVVPLAPAAYSTTLRGSARPSLSLPATT